MRIEEFIEARIAKDEAIARRQESSWYLVDGDLGWEAGTDLMEYFARQDPARVLRQCAALRAILETQKAYANEKFPDLSGGIAEGTEMALRELAAIWSDHPDYQQEWGA